MKTFRAELSILSPLITPIHGDTIFGHLCWGIIRHKGEAELNSFLSSFDADPSTPAIAISNAFPAGYLPKPALKPMTQKDNEPDEYRKGKKFRKMEYIPADLLLENHAAVTRDSLKNACLSREVPAGIESVKMHNTNDRMTGSTPEEGGVYSVSETWYRLKESGKRNSSEPIESTRMDIYITTDYPEERVKELLTWAFENGYGADASTGKGHLVVCAISEIKVPDTGNRAVALGHFVPGPADNLSCMLADIFVRYGKIGGDIPISDNPFKKPIVMFRQGSSFEPPDRPVVGTLLSDVHGDRRVRHHAFAPYLLFNEEGEET